MEMEVPCLSTHYAVMNAQEECVQRDLPLPVVLYHMYLKVVHSGKTLSEVLHLDDAWFGQFGSESLHITCSAGITPYERDFEPCLVMNFFSGLGLNPVGTEDMVSSRCSVRPLQDMTVLCAQGWPLSRGQMCGRSTRTIGRIPVTSEMSMKDLAALFSQPAPSHATMESLDPALSSTPPMGGLNGLYAPLYRCLWLDDCESFALLAKMAKKAILSFVQKTRGQGKDEQIKCMMNECSGWKVFQQFTETSWSFMNLYVQRLGGMLDSKQLRVMTAVGYATNASAAEISSNNATFCGHCFNVGCVKAPDGSREIPFLLEGTSSMYSIPVNGATPRVTVSYYDEDGKDTGKSDRLDMAAFLSALSTTMTILCSIMNTPHGGMNWKYGWDLPVEVTGWLGKTAVTPSLSSSKDTHMNFYHRIMYMGWPCTEGGLGCMPVEEESGISAGCHPYELSKTGVRGVGASLPLEMQEMMAAIMEEAVPPQAPRDIVQKIANMWIPCRPLETVNTDATREPGVSYFRVVSMESPCVPEYLSVMHEAKTRLAKEVNRINQETPNSDGCVMHALLEGTDSLLCIDVKNQTIDKLTIVQSIRKAKENLGYGKKNTPQACGG
jgi:hypothetical protein